MYGLEESYETCREKCLWDSRWWADCGKDPQQRFFVGHHKSERIPVVVISGDLVGIIQPPNTPEGCTHTATGESHPSLWALANSMGYVYMELKKRRKFGITFLVSAEWDMGNVHLIKHKSQSQGGSTLIVNRVTGGWWELKDIDYSIWIVGNRGNIHCMTSIKS